MGIIDKVEDQQGTRTLGIGSFKLIMEDWMLDKIREQKENTNKQI